MYGQALHQSPWQLIRDSGRRERARPRLRSRSSSQSQAPGLISGAIKAVLTLLSCVVYGLLSMAGALVALAIAIVAPVLLLFGTLAFVGLTLHLFGLFARGVGLV